MQFLTLRVRHSRLLATDLVSTMMHTSWLSVKRRRRKSKRRKRLWKQKRQRGLRSVHDASTCLQVEGDLDALLLRFCTLLAVYYIHGNKVVNSSSPERTGKFRLRILVASRRVSFLRNVSVTNLLFHLQVTPESLETPQHGEVPGYSPIVSLWAFDSLACTLQPLSPTIRCRPSI